MPPAGCGRWLAALEQFARIQLAIFPVLVLLRIYEVVLLKTSHVLPGATVGLLLRGLGADLVLLFLVAAVLALPLVLFGRWSPAAARGTHRLLLVAAALVAAALAQYFAITFVPLGADLFGYSRADIWETTATSRGLSVVSLLPFVVFAALTWFFTGRAARLPLRRPWLAAFYLLTATAPLWGTWVQPQPQQFASDAAYFLASNKTALFARQALGFAAASRRPAAPAAGFAAYPLLRPADDEDVLGPFFVTGTEPPNLVFIVVEGLGRDFMGPNAELGGFTPFLDSLAAQGLFWENFLATSGRTFGVLPALLGSLPPGERGFMELGAAMPPHLTLGRLLQERGYRTTYLSGTTGSFDGIDLFMERQKIARFVDQSEFGPAYEKQPASEGGVSWGYGDDELFKRGLQELQASGSEPRMDVYLTITTHEPFIPPNEAAYRAEFERRRAALPVRVRERPELRQYPQVFTTLLYTDRAVESFFREYRQRPDFERTIFFITGDHRLIPVPPGTRLARYRVPFLIYSPMLRQPRRFPAVSTHLDVTPSVLAFLHHNYGMKFPDRVHWLGSALDTARQFRHAGEVALMPNKNAMDDYLAEDLFLSRGQLFRVDDRLQLEPISAPARAAELQNKLDRFRELNRYVTTGDHLYPGVKMSAAERRQAAQEDSAVRALGLADAQPDSLFAAARTLALAGERESGRRVAGKVLRVAPNYHDARVLIGRTLAWDGRYDEARAILEEAVRRAPRYMDPRLALIDLELWAKRGDAALAAAEAALGVFPAEPALVRREEQARQMLRTGP